MKVVAEYLASEAMRTTDAIKFDLFSRSAFNRYYYAAFLTIRGVLKNLDPAWAKPTHQLVPVILQKEVLRRLKRAIKTATSSGQITESEGNRMYSLAQTAASELSNLLVSARETRRLADYQPETLVTRNGSTTILGKHTLEAARNWEGRVGAQSKTILKAYEQLGLI